MKSILGQLLNGRYFVVRQLKQTSSHITYLADDQHKLDYSQCLIKQYRLSIPRAIRNVPRSTKFRSFLFKEIGKIRQFNHHPQIPDLLDYFIWGEELYIIRQFIRGETVEEEIAHRTLEESEVFRLLQETLVVLDSIHQTKQMHLNLKPSNIILAAGNQQVFVADSHHLQHLLKNKIVKSKLLETTSIEDNYYLAPEQKSGKPQISSDFYALGAIAIQALTGKYPHEIRLCNLDNYARASLVDIETSQTTNISSQLGKIIHDLTKRNPASRSQSAKDILKSLNQPENVVLFPSPSAVLSEDAPTEPTFKPEQLVEGKQSKKKNKILPLLLGSFIFIISSLITLNFFLRKNNNQYENFVEYRNHNYNIAIKYPQEWTAKELEDPITGEIVVLTSPLTNESDSFQEKIYLSIDSIPTTQEKYQRTIIEKIENTSGVKNISYQKEALKLADRTAQSVTYQRKYGEINLQQKEIFVVRDENIYLITYIAEQNQYQDFLTTVNKIIKSFTVGIPSQQ